MRLLHIRSAAVFLKILMCGIDYCIGITDAVCPGSVLGWTITFSILGALGLYFLGGWGYGRFVSAKNPPKDG